MWSGQKNRWGKGGVINMNNQTAELRQEIRARDDLPPSSDVENQGWVIFRESNALFCWTLNEETVDEEECRRRWKAEGYEGAL